MTSSTLECRNETSVQTIEFELFISIQIRTTPLCTSVQQGSYYPSIDFNGENCSCVIANGGGVYFMNMRVGFSILVVLTGVIT